jgi:RNA polymerase sigma-70 factor (ECF subfamily)
VTTHTHALRQAPALPAAPARTRPRGDARVRTEEAFDSAVERMISGDEDAFRAVYRAVQPGLLRYLGVVVGRDDAEDVASETWSQAVRDLARFSGDGDGFRAWITTIGRHRALDHLRAKGRRPVADVEPADLPERAADDDTAGSACEALSTRSALDLIGSLPPDQAEAVLLRAVMGLSTTDTARVLGKRPGAVRTAAYRGLRTLQDRVAHDGSALPAPVAAVVRGGSDGSRTPGADEVR